MRVGCPGVYGPGALFLCQMQETKDRRPETEDWRPKTGDRRPKTEEKN